MEIGPGLEPLKPLCEDIVFVRGLFDEQSVKNNSVHLGRTPNLLSGAWVSLDQNDIRVGKTIDQVLAQQIGRQTAVSNLRGRVSFLCGASMVILGTTAFNAKLCWKF